ncbi:MAG: transposase [Gemmataceae bacterium]|nr:transposase [Gemmataceae bacterium]
MGVVAGHHLMFSGYGWWLPNDPRGSMSHEVRMPALAELGDLHHGRKRLQPARAELRAFHREAAPRLAYDVLDFDLQDVAVIGASFAETIRRQRYTCYACAIMPEHVHLLIRKHRDKAEQMLAALQDDSRAALRSLRPRWANHPVWGGLGWKVFEFTQDDMERTVRYIDKNTVERGLPTQRWEFVIPYDGWLPGIGAPRG